jgi:lipopolysaccharide export LptBFGC system permease protein LptF
MKRMIIFLALCSTMFCTAQAQGLAGSDMPKEILGRADNNEQIVALNAEIDRRRVTGLSTVALVLSSLCFGGYYLKRKQQKRNN